MAGESVEGLTHAGEVQGALGVSCGGVLCGDHHREERGQGMGAEAQSPGWATEHT